MFALGFLLLALQAAASRVALVTVVSPGNRPIVDVGPDDFVVREAGQPRDILSARIADYPVVVLIDDGEDGQRDFEVMRKAAARFIARLGQRPVAVGTLADSPALLASFDDLRASVLQKLDAARPRGGEDAILASVAGAAGVIQGLEAPFSAIVVLSTGGVDATRSAATDLLGRIVNSHAMVHVVAHRDPAHPPSAEVLRDISEQTRGQFTTIYSSASFQIALDHLADGMAKEMMIEYLVAPDTPPTGDVTLGVTIPGARVLGLGVR